MEGATEVGLHLVPTRTSDWIDRGCATAGRNLTQAEWGQYFPGRTYRAQCPQ